MSEPTTSADYAAMLRLDDQVHVVLGGGQGIGREAALALSAAGARVVVVDLEQERAEKVAAEVGGVAMAADVVDQESLTTLFASVAERFDTLDGVIDIIGLARYKRLLDITKDDLDWHHQFNLQHALWTIQCAAPQMAATGGGSISIVTSIAGLTSAPLHGIYGSEKAAMMALARTAAVELGPDGIRVNTVAPGLIRTPRQIANPAWTDELVQTNIGMTPLRKLGKPSDIAGALLFLALPISGHVTGQSIVVDGGESITYGIKTPEPTT